VDQDQRSLVVQEELSTLIAGVQQSKHYVHGREYENLDVRPRTTTGLCLSTRRPEGRVTAEARSVPARKHPEDFAHLGVADTALHPDAWVDGHCLGSEADLVDASLAR